MSLYGEAIRALRQVTLLDERVRNTAIDVAQTSKEVADLRDRVSRLEGMVLRAWLFRERRTRRAIVAGCRGRPIKQAKG